MTHHLPLRAFEARAATHLEEPIALLQVSVDGYPGALHDAASAVYREVRCGRRVVAVAGGPLASADRLVERLDAIGVVASTVSSRKSVLGDSVTVLTGSEITRQAQPPRRETPLRVALAGCGVVGADVARRLLRDPRTELIGVLVRDPDRPREIPLSRSLLLTDPGALLAREPDVVIEAISDASVGLALTRAALARGIHVISASKQALVADLKGLQALARAHDVQLLYSAAVGGGAALIEMVRRARAHGDIVLIEGVLNGTCNFILDRVAEGVEMSEALCKARKAGFAEEDPSADLDGRDAMAKLILLGDAAGHRVVDAASLSRSPLEPAALSGVGSQRQVARFDARTGVAGVRVEQVWNDPLLARLPDEWNAARVLTADGATFSALGRGAGAVPTGESVWADLADLLD